MASCFGVSLGGYLLGHFPFVVFLGSVFLKKGIRVKVAFWNRENTKMPNAAFRINASVCKNSQGFLEWPPTEQAASGCHAVTMGESTPWAQGKTERSSELDGRHVVRTEARRQQTTPGPGKLR